MSHCRNMNHGRSQVSISYCPECGVKFGSAQKQRCNREKHMDYRKQRFIFCIDCGVKLATEFATDRKQF